MKTGTTGMADNWQRMLVAVVMGFAMGMAGATLAEDASCRMCHQPVATGGITHRAHGLGADPRGQQGAVSCISCHGPSSVHASAPRNPPDFPFSKGRGAVKADGETDADSTCLDCHDGGAMGHWAFSAHANAGLGCTSCHSIHMVIDRVQERDAQFAVCTDCHQRKKMDQMKFSRHPMAEGLVQCSDCHAPHGGTAMSGLAQPTVNDTCYQCHAEKRGPFLFEHEPVQDDCTHCHLPLRQ